MENVKIGLMQIIRNTKLVAAYFKASINAYLVYKGSFFVDLVGRVISLSFVFLLWTKIYQSKTSIEGITLSSILVYYVFATIVRMLANPNISNRVSWDVRGGRLSFRILRPTHPFYYYLGLYFARRVIDCGLMILFSIIALVWVFPAFGLQVGELHIMPFIGLAIIATLLSFIMGILIGMSAFWIYNANPVTNGFSITSTILGGLLVPIAFFPPTVRAIINFLPFRFMISEPVLALQGQIKGINLFYSFGLGLFWIAISYILMLIVWKKGAKRFDAVGN